MASRRSDKSNRRQHKPAARGETSSRAPRRATPVWRKLLFALVTTAAFFVALELVLALFGVGVRADQADPYVGFSSHAPLFVAAGSGEGAAMRTADNKLTWFNEQSFPKKKPNGAYRVFCLGGSTTYGRPYFDATSFSGWLRELLPAADASRRWEVINAGGISYASYRVARVMEELLAYEPDLFIIYTGHNEFLEERTYRDLRETPDSLRGLGALLSKTRTYSAAVQLLQSDSAATTSPNSAVQPQNLLPGEVKALLDSAVGPDMYHRDDRLREQVAAHFRLNLNRMIDLAHSAGAKVILITPASNVRDCSPFKSEFSAELSGAKRVRWQTLYDGARRAFTNDDYEIAIDLLDEAAAIDSRRADLYYLRGRAHLAMEQFDAARADLQRALEEDVCPLRAPEALRRQVVEAAAERDVPLIDFAAYAEAQDEQRITGEKQFLDHVHPTIDMHRQLALLLVDEMAKQQLVQPGADWGDVAIDEVTRRVEQRIDQQTHATALKNLSKVLGWAGKHEEAARLALRALALTPDDPGIQYQAGNAYLRRGEHQQALACFQRALDVDGPTAPIHYGLALAYSGLGELDQTLAHYQQAVQIDPGFADAHYNLANLHQSRGDLDGAALHFQKAIDINPRDDVAYNSLGVVRAMQNQMADAQQQFEQALRINPQSADALVNLGRVFAERGQRDEAIAYYRRALQFAPGRPDIVELLRQVEQP